MIKKKQKQIVCERSMVIKMKKNVKELVAQMTLEEKAAMCSGADFWHTVAIERLGIPAVMVSDGPHGLRKQDDKGDHLGMNDSIKAVCFPAACATASSFDRELLYHMGETLGNECQAEKVSILLGPAVNIKRSPLCGRNFEYISEDPYLTGKLSSSYIAGVQSKNIGTSMKHFAVNSQEYRRMSCSSNLDERTLREIYLSAFEMAVREVQPWTLMCSYNKVNGEFASENKMLLTDILRDEWGFEGYVMSDWGAVNDRVCGLKAGLDLEMPGSNGTNDKQIMDAVNRGELSQDILDKTVERILTKTFTYIENQTGGIFDLDADHEAACQIERESIVLLKNNDILPLKKEEFIGDKRLAFIGEFASKPRFQGGGSSHINSHKVTSALDAVKEIVNVSYAQGYTTINDEIDEMLQEEAVQTAKSADMAVLFVGLPDSFESEGYDRKHLDMPKCQNRLIEKVCEVQKNVIVVLHNGSPVLMPWLGKVSGVVEAYLGGQAVGQAVVDVLFGKTNPSGRLAETFPLRLEDTPAYYNYQGNGDDVYYEEGVFVGYRWYDIRKMDVLFPFGYGLSYTSFQYSNLVVSKDRIREGDILEVSVDVTNTGHVTGKEVVQLYIGDRTGGAVRPVKELKGFDKVELAPGETKTVTMELGQRDFAWYNVSIHDWCCNTGKYEILIGKSVQDIVLSKEIIMTDVKYKKKYTVNTCCGEIMKDPAKKALIQLYIAGFEGNVSPSGEAAQEAISDEMTNSMIDNMPLRSLRSFSSLTNEKLEEIVNELNRMSI